MKEENSLSARFNKQYSKHTPIDKRYKARQAAFIKWADKRYLKENSKTLLDIGCGNGVLLSMLKRSYQSKGLDISKEEVSLARRRVKGVGFIAANMLNFELKEKFDIITCFDAIDHGDDLRKGIIKTLSNLYRHLEDEGILIFSLSMAKDCWIKEETLAIELKQNKPLSVTELLYPLLVGYDSVHLRTDIEIGGTDQLFNFVASREIQKAYGQQSEVIITLPLLEGTDGVKKMSKSYGNATGVTDEPDNMYGKIMSISDKAMLKYYKLVSDTSLEELDAIKASIASGKSNAMEYKQRLAHEMVSRYHSPQAAKQTEDRFNLVHRRKHENIKEQVVTYTTDADLSLIGILRGLGTAKSNTEARKLIEQGAVKVGGTVIKDINYTINPEREEIIQSGKRHFAKVKCVRHS